MLRLGIHRRENRTLLAIDPRDLLCHTAVIGQSGSGKSYLVARMIEEMILRTRARVVVLDPNGDFRRISEPAPTEVWNHDKLSTTLSFLHSVGGDESFDERSAFCSRWALTPVQYLTYRRTPPWEQLNPDVRSMEAVPAVGQDVAPAQPRPVARTRPRTAQSAARKLRDTSVTPVSWGSSPTQEHRAFLCIHWGNIPDEQNFLLQLDPIAQPRVYLACDVCRRYLESQPAYQHGYGLRELESTALAFASNRELRIRTLQGSLLNEDDYMSLQGQVAELRSRFSLLYDSDMESAEWAPTDLSGFLLKSFRETVASWRVCVIELGAAPRPDMLLAADVALSVLLREARLQWQRVLHPRSTADTRVPTFIVIDEAHVFAPSESDDRLQRRVSDRIAEIAAEGRKYGLFCVLATQRPEKLRRGILEECENACLLRIQSKHERSIASAALGMPEEVVDQVASVRSGEGLISGRWVPAPSLVRFAVARTTVGGGNLDPTYWTRAAEERPRPNFVKLFSKAVETITTDSAVAETEIALEKLKVILHAIDGDAVAKAHVTEVGITGQNLGQLLGSSIPELRPFTLGFAKLTEVIQLVCTGTALCMYANPPFEVRLGYRSSVPEGFILLPDLERRPVDRFESYRLALGTDLPILRPPAREVLDRVTAFLIASPPVGESLGGLLERATQALRPNVGALEVKATLLCLIASECFDRAPEGTRLAEQTLTLRSSLRSGDTILTSVRQAILRKLRDKIGDVDETVVDSLLSLPRTSPTSGAEGR